MSNDTNSTEQNQINTGNQVQDFDKKQQEKGQSSTQILNTLSSPPDENTNQMNPLSNTAMVTNNDNTMSQGEQIQIDSQGDTELVTISNENNDVHPQNKNHKHDTDPGEARNNYFKLISGTSLDKVHQTLTDDDDSLDNSDYMEQEESTDASEKSSPQALVDVTVGSTFENILDSGHFSPRHSIETDIRGRGRGILGFQQSNTKPNPYTGILGASGVPNTGAELKIKERLKQLIMFKSLYWNIRSKTSRETIIALTEPFHKDNKLDKYKRILSYHYAHSNYNSQIWIFWDSNTDCTISDEDDQQVTCTITINGTPLLITYIYAKCDAQLRVDLRNKLRSISDNYNLPWLVTGDFNCIIDPVEKKGRSLHRMSKCMEFIQCIMDCELLDAGYTGSPFTWCNGWVTDRRVWQRLDRALTNHLWVNTFDTTNVYHLIKTGYDHSPLLIIANSSHRNPIKYFKFLDFWIEEPNFLNIVEQAWSIDVDGSPLWKFHLKLKNTSKMLSAWSWNTIGNIFTNIKVLEEKVTDLENLSIRDNSEINRTTFNQANVELIRAYKKEESYWKQKFGIKSFVEGEVNSTFFHSIEKGRKMRLNLTSIQDDHGNWISGDDNIAQQAVQFFENQFTKEDTLMDDNVMNHIPKIISEEENTMLLDSPSMDELKDIIFSMSTHSAPGPYGFFHFSDLRLIILSNFSNKIISKLMNQRLTPVMQKIISPYQTSFIKGRSISENIILTQEMVHNINQSLQHGNIILKLDMAKAYDRVNWDFLCLIMKRMGFSNLWIDRIWRLISNVWYSIDLNGLSLGDLPSLNPMMSKLDAYEKISGQIINRRKSGFLVSANFPAECINDVENITGFSQLQFPMKYLGCPIYRGTNKIVYYNNMVAKVSNRLQGWQGQTGRDPL
ncbi:uncharacterized protein LOC132066425 [Lycium ferocissimum]|uniref:uncharacterized protein LOC132066425 n=1 Tax=Lycium ferocissimum TaxID=112874 RepID=UPI0028159FB2|nr:uncharacterized protein LOC132066425 [Lycium ferocissimum]